MHVCLNFDVLCSLLFIYSDAQPLQPDSRHVTPSSVPSIISHDPVLPAGTLSCSLQKAQSDTRSSSLALRILSPLFMSAQVGPWEQAKRGPVSIRNTGRHNELCLQLHCWQTPTQRGWKGSPSVLTHTEEWVSVRPLRAVFVQYTQLLFLPTVLPSMGSESVDENHKEGTPLWMPARVHIH